MRKRIGKNTSELFAKVTIFNHLLELITFEVDLLSNPSFVKEWSFHIYFRKIIELRENFDFYSSSILSRILYKSKARPFTLTTFFSALCAALKHRFFLHRKEENHRKTSYSYQKQLKQLVRDSNFQNLPKGPHFNFDQHSAETFFGKKCLIPFSLKYCLSRHQWPPSTSFYA